MLLVLLVASMITAQTMFCEGNISNSSSSVNQIVELLLKVFSMAGE